MMRQWVFTVRVNEGRKFPKEISGVLLSATFAGETKFTSVVKGSTRTKFESTLQLVWEVDSEELRNVGNSGTTACKLTASDVSNGNSLGWVVLDLRTAKLNGARKDAWQGEWLELTGARSEAGPDPELKLFYSFKEKGFGPSSPVHGDAELESDVSDAVGRAARALEERQQAFGSPTPSPQPPGNPVSSSSTPEAMIRHGASAAPPPMALAAPEAASPGAILAPPPAPDLVRRFKLGLDLRSLKTTRSLPVNLAAVSVQAYLPKDFKRLINGSARKPFPTPLSTTSVNVARASEVALPNGFAEVDFVTDVMTLASALAEQPQVMVEIWHKERMKDMMLGMASVPLAALLQEPWVDRYAAVFAVMRQTGSEEEYKEQVAAVRVILSLEELGIAPRPQASDASAAVSGSPIASPSGSPAPDVSGSVVAAAIRDTPPEEKRRGRPSLGPAVGDQGGQGPSQDEIQAAYELEVWKAEEEKRWRAELREREAERLSVLEAEWRNRESLRDAELQARREEYSRLEGRAREVLKEMVGREARLVAAEEAIASRRGELERSAAARVGEAEAAVRRLQAECEHQLELERHRNEEIGRAKLMAEERLRAAENRADEMEAAFQAYRASEREQGAGAGARQAKTEAELAEVRAQLHNAEERERDALSAKGRYKDQVSRLASELSAMQRARAEEQRQQGLALGRQLEAATVAASWGRPAGVGPSWGGGRGDPSELEALRLQLRDLKSRAGFVSGREGSKENMSPRPVAEKSQRPQTAPNVAGSTPLSPIVTKEIRRLQRERAALLETGVYEEGDPLVKEIDRRLDALEAQQQQQEHQEDLSWG